jgi:ferric-dicitrate binding protein FerR (iron transport regulator)
MNTIKKIIFDFLSGNSTPSQKKILSEWLISPKNQILFYEILDEWQMNHEQINIDTEKALRSFLISADSSNNKFKVIQNLTVGSNPIKWYAIAASVFLVFSLFAAFFYFELNSIIYKTGNAEIKTIKLNDGTSVILNANSKLTIPRFDFSKRIALLEGEAEFKVSHTKDNSHFIVKTNNDFEIEVLGTEFLFYSRNKVNRVLLTKGKIQVNYFSGKHLSMKPGDLVSLEGSSNRIQLTRATQVIQYSAWKSHQFYFESTSLLEFSNLLNEQFGVELICEDSTMYERRLMGYFKAESSDQVAKVLSILLNVPVEQRGNFLIVHSSKKD